MWEHGCFSYNVLQIECCCQECSVFIAVKKNLWPSQVSKDWCMHLWCSATHMLHNVGELLLSVCTFSVCMYGRGASFHGLHTYKFAAVSHYVVCILMSLFPGMALSRVSADLWRPQSVHSTIWCRRMIVNSAPLTHFSVTFLSSPSLISFSSPPYPTLAHLPLSPLPSHLRSPVWIDMMSSWNNKAFI